LAVKNAASVEVARERLAEGVAGIVVDLAHARIDVVEFIRSVKAAEATRSVPVMAFVAHVDVERRTRAEAAGADLVVPRSAFQRALPEFLDGLPPQGEAPVHS
jgi:CheY-like chemotaxis protein